MQSLGTSGVLGRNNDPFNPATIQQAGGGQSYGGGGNTGFLANLLGSPQSPQGFGVNPNALSGAWGSAFGDISGLQGYQGFGNAVLDPSQQTMSNMYNNPFAAGAVYGSQTGANYGAPIANNMWMGGNALQGAGLNTLPYAYSVMNAGFDPQNALYDRTAQRVQDQTRAGEAARGIATSPYGAGLEADSMRNFNIDWQNNQLQRMVAGAGAGGSLLGQGANVAGAGVNMQQQIPDFMARTSMLPYATWNTIGSGQNQALQQYLQNIGGAMNIGQLPIQDWLGYMGAGTAQQNANTNLYKAQLDAQKNQLGFLGDIGKGIGSVVGAIL